MNFLHAYTKSGLSFEISLKLGLVTSDVQNQNQIWYDEYS